MRRVVVVDLVKEVAVRAHVRVLRRLQPRLRAFRGVHAVLPAAFGRLGRLSLHEELLLALQPLAVPLHRDVLRKLVTALGVVRAEAQLAVPERLLLQVAWRSRASARA